VIKNIILASASPRRKELLSELIIGFDVEVRPVEEVYPSHLQREEITDYLAKLKAQPYAEDIEDDTLVITADTIVWHEGKAFGKPKNIGEGAEMLRSLSGKIHEVITSVCFTTKESQTVAHCISRVTFNPISEVLIDWYLRTYIVTDWAGAYAIQGFIGAAVVASIEGSYNNVVGLPTHIIYDYLTKMK
jgi:septum formation protein maf